MDARYQEVAEALRRLPPGQASCTLDLVARVRGLTDKELHERTGRAMSQATINHKRSGRSLVKAADLWPLAEAVGVDLEVLLLPPSKALAWLAEHRAKELDAVLSNLSRTQECSAPKLSRPLLGGKILVRVPPGGIRAAA